MNASKLLISSAAALAVVGAIGLANAQSTAPAATSTDAQMNKQPPAAATNGTMNNNSTTNSGTLNNNTTNSGTMNSTMPSGELNAQVDRN